MGCDIHLRIQVQNGEAWEDVPYKTEPWQPRDTDDAYGQQQWRLFDERHGEPLPDAFDARNYNLFGMLADVRNGTWGDEWPVLKPPSGLPDGIDIEAEPWLGDHSFTTLTLEELESYGWDSIQVNGRGCVSAEVYAQTPKGDRPSSYSAGAGGGSVVTYEPEEWEARGRKPQFHGESSYVWARWSQTARQGSRDWPGLVLPRLREIAAGRPLRLLVGFDN